MYPPNFGASPVTQDPALEFDTVNPDLDVDLALASPQNQVSTYRGLGSSQDGGIHQGGQREDQGKPHARLCLLDS